MKQMTGVFTCSIATFFRSNKVTKYVGRKQGLRRADALPFQKEENGGAFFISTGPIRKIKDGFL